MEEYKIIDGKRHYRTGPNDIWKLDNRTTAQMSLGYQGSTQREPKIVSTRTYQGHYRRKKNKEWKKWLPFLLVGGILLGAIYNYHYVSDEEIFIEEYLKEWNIVKGEPDEKD